MSTNKLTLKIMADLEYDVLRTIRLDAATNHRQTGIFVTRMHDKAHSMAGLLGIGDRIIAIDRRPVESFDSSDVSRLNQVINDKCKLRLKVEPFRG